MFTTRIRSAGSSALISTRRFISNKSLNDGRRFVQTIPIVNSTPEFYSGLNYSMATKPLLEGKRASGAERWSKHSLGSFGDESGKTDIQAPTPVVRRSRASRYASKTHKDNKEVKQSTIESKPPKSTSVNNIETTNPVATKKAETKTEVKPKKRRELRPRKALITLSPSAVEHLKDLLNQPKPEMIRIGVQNRGCSGLTYNLEYVTEAGKFDELVEQDGVKVLIDSKALFSIVGSEMDWLDDKLSSKFIFKNPNSKGTCGCGESFMV